MSTQIPTANFLVDPVELRRAGTVLLTAVAMIEASHASRAGRPISFLFGQATLAPIVSELANLATVCGHTAANYESCEAALTPSFLKDFALVEPALAKAAAAVALQLDTVIGGGETPVEVAKVTGGQSAPPVNLQDVLGRLARASSTQQILVESSTTTTGRQFVLYLPGTENWQPVPNTKAFDLTSDLAAMSRPGISAPEKAAVQALTESGFGENPTDSLVIAGYSEGGLIGANLLASGAITKLGGRATGLIAIGSPIASVKVPAEVKVISVEHANDLVPKLDLATHNTTSNWFTQKLTPSGVLGHSLDSYRDSVTQLDAKANSTLDRRVQQILGRTSESAQSELAGFTARRL